MHEADILDINVELLRARVQPSADLLADGLPGLEQLIGVICVGKEVHCATIVLRISWPMELNTFFSYSLPSNWWISDSFSATGCCRMRREMVTVCRSFVPVVTWMSMGLKRAS
jgi:hypothetical protein